jgi:hypothetical protein
MTDTTVEAIDNALRDYDVSPDAMRWMPESSTRVRPQPVRLPPEVGEWRNDALVLAGARLWLAGFSEADILAVLDALRNMLVPGSYYVPTMDELWRDYNRLGMAHLHGRIRVRWVMCQETHDALAARLRGVVFAVVPDFALNDDAEPPPTPRELMQPGSLFGIPIRLDPAARKPMFEIFPLEAA